jgi:hypothetical protein
MKYLVSALCLGFVLSISAASAETKAAAPKPRTAKSIECSKLADAKGLHGKERKVFRAKCKKGET